MPIDLPARLAYIRWHSPRSYTSSPSHACLDYLVLFLLPVTRIVFSSSIYSRQSSWLGFRIIADIT